jgi:hypothetical protein
MDKFQIDLIKGQKNEQIFQTQILDRYFKNAYTAVTHTEEYKDKDIDFITRNLSFEVKSSRIKTHIPIELISNDFLGKQGWFYYCEADHICYINQNEGYLIRLNFKKYWNEYENILKDYTAITNDHQNVRTGKSAFTYLPLSGLTEGKHYKLTYFNDLQ